MFTHTRTLHMPNQHFLAVTFTLLFPVHPSVRPSFCSLSAYSSRPRYSYIFQKIELLFTIKTQNLFIFLVEKDFASESSWCRYTSLSARRQSEDTGNGHVQSYRCRRMQNKTLFCYTQHTTHHAMPCHSFISLLYAMPFVYLNSNNHCRTWWVRECFSQK